LSDIPTINAWVFVPARGGSKSILLKNLVMLGNRPLLDYGILASQASGSVSRIVCSTDHPDIADRARALNVEVVNRPADLAGDDISVDMVVRAFLMAEAENDVRLPEIIVLVQPTSPFLLPDHITDLISLLESRPDAMSAHNVIPVSHNSHAWNQRTLDTDGIVSMLYEKERRNARLKQQKPKLLIFGNLIAARTSALLEGFGFYAQPCVGTMIEALYGFDLDGPNDLPIAESVLRSGMVELSYLGEGASIGDPRETN